MEKIERIPKEFDPMGYTKLRGARQLSDQKRKVLKNLFLWREKEARRVDRPPFMILQPSMLVPLARKEITDVEGVKSFLGKRRRKNQDLCQAIFESIQLGMADIEIEL
ncbi:MAG: HRDC domain-containing protein [Promethearchaeota archaeon]